MNLNLYLTELKINLKSTLIWTTGIVIAILLIMIVVGNQIKYYNDISYNQSGFDILSVYLLISQFIMYIGSIFSMIFGSTILSKEEDYKTIEIIYSTPIKRTEIALSKYFAFFSCVFLMNVIILITVFINLEIFKSPSGYDISLFLLMGLDQFFVMLLMGSFGFLLSLFIIRGGAAIGISIGINIMMIILASLGQFGKQINNNVLEIIGNFSIYTYSYVDFLSPKINLVATICFAGAIMIFVILAISLYSRKDFQN